MTKIDRHTAVLIQREIGRKKYTYIPLLFRCHLFEQYADSFLPMKGQHTQF